MHDRETLKQLESATAPRDATSGSAASETSPDDLRAAWQKVSKGLTERDQRLAEDHGQFMAQILARLDMEPSQPSVQPAASAAAIVHCMPTEERPLGWRGFLALATCIALVGAAVMWLAPSGSSDKSRQAEQASRAGELLEPSGQPVVAKAPESPPRPPEAVKPDAELAVAAVPAWDDPLDTEIAAAREQLASLRETTEWERSLVAFEEYRQSVEDELNEELEL